MCYLYFKKNPASLSKDAETFVIKDLYCYVIATIHLATGNPIASWLTTTVNKINHGPVITPSSEEILKCLQKPF